MGNVAKQVDLVRAQFERLNAEAMKVSRGLTGPMAPKDLAQLKRGIGDIRSEYLTAASAGGAFLTEQRNITSASTAFNDQLSKQKVRLRDIYKNMAVVKQAYREQIALNNMQVASWSRSATGKINADLVVPSDAIRQTSSFTKQLGYANTMAKSVSQEMVNMGKNIQWSGRQLMVGFTVPTMIAAGAMGKFAYDMDKGMTNIVKVYDAGANGIKASTQEIRDQAMESAKAMAQTYGQSTKDTLDIMGQLAAAGRTGNELTKQTADISRAALLGELNVQDAIKTNMTLQSAYGLSTKQLGDQWNFFNSIENATVLTMQDLSEALPRVSGIMKANGVSIKDTTVLLTAFKAAGIDAVEGATALKSIAMKVIAPRKTARDSFLALTGIDYQDILDKTKGALMPTLMEVSKAVQGLTNQQKTDLISGLIGIHQGSKFAGLLTQLGNLSDATTQVGRANKIAQQSTQQWADTANGELKAINESVSQRMKKAFATVQAQLAITGQDILKVVAPLAEAIANFTEWFNKLPGWAKKGSLLALAFVGAIGPVTMLTGLMLNMAGTMLRVLTAVVGLGAKFKVLNPETKAAEILSKLHTKELMNEKDAVLGMTEAIQAQTIAMQKLLEEKGLLNATGVDANISRAAGAAGTPAVRLASVNANKLILPPGLAMSMSDMNAGATRIDSLSKSTAKNWSLIANKAQAFTMAATAGVSLFGPSGKINDIANAAFMISMIGPSVAKLNSVQRVAGGIGNAFGKVGNVIDAKIIGRVGAAKGAFSALGSFVAGPWGLGIGAALGVVAVTIGKINSDIAKSNEHLRAAADSAQAWADTLGYAYKDPSTMPGPKAITKNSFEVQMNMIDKLKANNQDLYDQLASMQGKEDPASVAKKWAMAVNEAEKVRLSGGSAKNAKDAAETALRIMGEKFSTLADFESRIHVKIDFSNVDSQIKNIQSNVQAAVKQATGNGTDISGWESFGRVFSGGNDITSVDARNIDDQLNTWYTMFKKMDDKHRVKMLLDMQKSLQSGFTDSYKKAIGMGLIDKGTSMDDYISKLSSIHDPQVLARLGVGAKQLDAYRYSIQKLKDELNQGNNKDITNITQIGDAVLGQSDAWKQLKQAQQDASGGASLASTREYRNAQSQYAEGAKAAADATAILAEQSQFAAFQQDQLRAAMKAMQPTIDAYKQSMTDVQGTVFDELSQQAQDAQQAQDDARQALEKRASDALDARYQRLSDAVDARTTRQENELATRQDRASKALDAKQNRMEAAFDAKSNKQDAAFQARQDAIDAKRTKQDRAFDAKWQAASDRLDKQQQNRRDNVSAMYDKRIAKINAVIDAEQAAEQKRQDIFQAEKERIAQLADLQNKNIDFNMAVNSGNLDDAAKIANDIQATQEQNAQDAASTESQTASDKRVAAYQKEIDALNATKDARLKQLDDVDKAESKALDANKQRAQDEVAARRKAEDRMLKAEQDAAKKRLSIERKNAEDVLSTERDLLSKRYADLKNALDRRATLEKKALDKSQKAEQNKLDASNRAYANSVAAQRRMNQVALDAELAAIRAHIPKNMQELRGQISAIQAAYKRHGVVVKGMGTKWAKVIENALVQYTLAAGGKIKSDNSWKSVGAQVAQFMTKGAMNLTPSELIRALTTGVFPSKWTVRHNQQQANASNKQNAMRQAYHSGGIVGMGGARTGYAPNASKGQREVDTRLLAGEGVLNTKAMSAPGMRDLVELANKGKVSDMIGDGTPTGLAGSSMLPMVGMVGQSMLAGFEMAVQNAVSSQASVSAGGLTKGQAQNAATILGVGKSMGASRRDLIVSIMTAMQESGLRNLRGGDRDSLGLFQQRPSAGWGTPSEILNPKYSSTKFFNALLGLGSGRNEMSMTQEAQAVQRSAFPSAYAKWEDMAKSIVNGANFGGGGFSGFNNMNIGALLTQLNNGGMGMGSANGDYRNLWRIIKSHFPEEILTSGYRPGATVAGFGNASMHAMGRAIDIVPEKKVWDWLLKNYGGSSFELLSPWGMYRNGKPYYSAITQANHQDHIHWALTHGGKIPGLSTGGKTLNTGLARLHPDETVLTKPLTAKLENGIEQIDSGMKNEYNFNMEFTGPVSNDMDFTKFKRDVQKVLRDIQKDNGPRRKII